MCAQEGGLILDRGVHGKLLEEKASELCSRDRHDFHMCQQVRVDVEEESGLKTRPKQN